MWNGGKEIMNLIRRYQLQIEPNYLTKCGVASHAADINASKGTGESE